MASFVTRLQVMSADYCDIELRSLPEAGAKRTTVFVRHAYKKYGSVKVLQDLNLTGQEHSIYALLGSSGCGKTTLLSCLVGRQPLDSGQIHILGNEVTSQDFGVPRKLIGYMPQTVALYSHLTIKETLQYFGCIFYMKNSEIEKRIPFLLKLLDLPHGNNKTKNLSGGQQRRVSFAIAVLHDPAIMILDEPTVGVDPLLRNTIWDHLVHLSTARGKTIIITTHYIEEARQANKIGMMRNGYLIAEDEPNVLLNHFDTASLEHVFMRLSEQQESQMCSEGTSKSILVDGKRMLEASTQELESVEQSFFDNSLTKNSAEFLSIKRIQALLYNNSASLWRDIWLLFLILSQSILVPLITYYAFRNLPDDLPLAVVVHDTNSTAFYSNCSMNVSMNSCEKFDLPCRFLAHLSSPDFTTEFYNSTEDSVEAVRRGDAWGSLYFRDNFTTALAERISFTMGLTDDVLEDSNIVVQLDMADFIVSRYVVEKLQNKFIEFLKRILTACELNPKLAGLPIRVNSRVYGQDIAYVDSIELAFVLFIIYFFGVTLSAPAIVSERSGGLLDRNLVAAECWLDLQHEGNGTTLKEPTNLKNFLVALTQWDWAIIALVKSVKPLEILLSHLVAQFTLLVLQVSIIFIFGFFVIDMTCIGNRLLAATICICLAFCGQVYGLVISVCSPNELTADVLAAGSCWPMIILSGLVWPLEGMPVYMRRLCSLLPLTQPIAGIRAVALRGATLSNQDVYVSFLSIGGWTVIYMLLCMFALMCHKL